MSEKKVSFLGAILININIVVGCAFFLGASTVAQKCGFWAPLAWLMCGLFLAPLVAAFAYFAKRYPEAGGIYWYSQKTLGSWWGFVSGWSYFIGTMASNAAILKAFSSAISLIPCMRQPVALLSSYGINFDIVCVIFFALCSLCDISLLERMQVGFSCLKMIPFVVLFVGLFFLADFQAPQTIAFSLGNLWGTVPIVFFAYIGIEACCAIMDKIKNPERNGFKVLVVSFVCIVALYTLFQACVVLVAPADGSDPFLSVLPRLLGTGWLATWGNALVYAAITSSFLAGFYGMFYFNNWNLHALAQDNSLVGSATLRQLNKQGAPWVCVLLQAFLLIVLLIVTTHIEYLITMGDFGVVIAYTLTAVSFLMGTKSIIAMTAFGSCGLLTYLCTQSLVTSSVWNVIPFVAMLGVGIFGYALKKYWLKNKA